MNINLEGDLGSITQIDFENYLKTNYGIGNIMPMALPTFDYTKHSYPYCVSYTIDSQLYYLFTCEFYDALSKYKTYYLINTEAVIDNADEPDTPTVYHIKSRYLKPISGIAKGVWTDWSTEDSYTYNFLLACGGVTSGSDGSGGSKITLKIWNSKTEFEKNSIDLTINKLIPSVLFGLKDVEQTSLKDNGVAVQDNSDNSDNKEINKDDPFIMNMNELYLLEDTSVPVYTITMHFSYNSDGTLNEDAYESDLMSQLYDPLSYLIWYCKTTGQTRSYAYGVLHINDDDLQTLYNAQLEQWKKEHPDATEDEITAQEESLQESLESFENAGYTDSLFLFECTPDNENKPYTLIPLSSSGYGNVRADTSSDSYSTCSEVFMPTNFS